MENLVPYSWIRSRLKFESHVWLIATTASQKPGVWTDGMWTVALESKPNSEPASAFGHLHMGSLDILWRHYYTTRMAQHRILLLSMGCKAHHDLVLA